MCSGDYHYTEHVFYCQERICCCFETCAKFGVYFNLGARPNPPAPFPRREGGELLPSDTGRGWGRGLPQD
jgi:hypothetical protein